MKFCEFFAKYAAVSLPIVTPHWVYLGAIWARLAAALAASCCRRRLARFAAALAASLSVGAVWPALLQPWLLRCLSAPYGPHCCSLGCFVVCRRRMALVAAALAASLPSSLGTPRRGRASTGCALAEVLELRRCLRRLASLPLGAVVSQLLRFPVDFFDSVELSLQSLARLISFSADFHLACLCTQVLCGH